VAELDGSQVGVRVGVSGVGVQVTDGVIVGGSIMGVPVAISAADFSILF
jgi:hypothetical protein